MGNSLILGFFDGVHIAHQAVICSAGLDSVLVTFRNSPASYFNKTTEYICSREESVNRIKMLGVKEVIELDFPEIAGMTAEAYLEYLVNNFAPISISTGFNHTFGFNKSGNPEFLEKNQKKYGYKYICVPPQLIDGQVVSSTLIKNLLIEGKTAEANKMLGRNFALEGIVIKGAQLGRTIGFPTANIEYPQNIVNLPFGVYKIETTGHAGIMNWGMKPTVHNTLTPVAEVHILNFNEDLYGQKIRIEVINKIRSEKKFSGLDELKQQIKKDINTCLEL